MKMAKGEIIIDENLCRGCGYCVEFCSRDCIVISGDKISPQGFMLPTVSNPEDCTACCICAWLCPHSAIEVYKFVEEGAPAST